MTWDDHLDLRGPDPFGPMPAPSPYHCWWAVSAWHFQVASLMSKFHLLGQSEGSTTLVELLSDEAVSVWLFWGACSIFRCFLFFFQCTCSSYSIRQRCPIRPRGNPSDSSLLHHNPPPLASGVSCPRCQDVRRFFVAAGGAPQLTLGLGRSSERAASVEDFVVARERQKAEALAAGSVRVTGCVGGWF